MPTDFAASSSRLWYSTRLVLTATLLIVIGACSGVETVRGAPEDLIDLDDSHAAVALVAEGATDAAAFGEAARERGIDFICTAGGIPPYELCLVADDGVLAILPLSGVNDQIVRLSDAGLTEDVLVPMDTGEPVGVRGVSPRVRVQIEYFDEVVGDLEGRMESLR